METGPAAQALLALAPDAFEAALNARACGVLGPLRLTSPRRIWPIVAQIADRLNGPRTALVAEAAHVVPPIGAQGLNMSLRDIAVLLDLCVAARDGGGDIGAPELLARYHRARHADILLRVGGRRRAQPGGDGRLGAAARRAADRAAAAARRVAGAPGGDAAGARRTLTARFPHACGKLQPVEIEPLSRFRQRSRNRC